MLERLLGEIQEGGTLRPAVLAARLDTSVAMVQAMLEELERMGLLRQMQASCAESACGGCSLASACSVKPGANGRVWILTRKSRGAH